MSHYRVRIGNSPIVHASPLHSGALLYCRMTRAADAATDPTGELVTCPDCRAILKDIWMDIVEAQARRDHMMEYHLDDDGQGMSRVRILARRKVEGKGPFIRFTRRWDSGQEQLTYYKLERFINLLIDGNAFMSRQNRGEAEWKYQPENNGVN